MKRNQFTFYRSFYEAVMRLPKCRQATMVMAIVEYALNGVEPVGLSTQQLGQFLLIKPILNTANKKAISGSAGGKISRRGCAEKISKKEKEVEIEVEIEDEQEGFAQFWGMYPKKIGKEEAAEAWAGVREEKEKIFSSLALWCRYDGWREQGGRFVPKPAKWLKERWWEQDPPGVIPVGASGVLGKAELEALAEMMGE